MQQKKIIFLGKTITRPKHLYECSVQHFKYNLWASDAWKYFYDVIAHKSEYNMGSLVRDNTRMRNKLHMSQIIMD